MKARPTIPMAAPCTTTEATKEDGPLRGSGWIENRVIVREDLIRRVDPSQIELPAPTLHAKQVFEQCECCWSDRLTAGRWSYATGSWSVVAKLNDRVLDSIFELTRTFWSMRQDD